MKTRTITKNILGNLFILSLIIAASCDKIEFEKPYECKVDTKYILTPSLAFTIDSINDYRCPQDVICIWGGDVDLFINIRLNHNYIDTVLKLSGGPYIFGDYSWSIQDVTPWRNHDQIVEQDDYRVKVLIQKN